MCLRLVLWINKLWPCQLDHLIILVENRDYHTTVIYLFVATSDTPNSLNHHNSNVGD